MTHEQPRLVRRSMPTETTSFMVGSVLGTTRRVCSSIDSGAPPVRQHTLHHTFSSPFLYTEQTTTTRAPPSASLPMTIEDSGIPRGRPSWAAALYSYSGACTSRLGDGAQNIICSGSCQESPVRPGAREIRAPAPGRRPLTPDRLRAGFGYAPRGSIGILTRVRSHSRMISPPVDSLVGAERMVKVSTGCGSVSVLTFARPTSAP